MALTRRLLASSLIEEPFASLRRTRLERTHVLGALYLPQADFAPPEQPHSAGSLQDGRLRGGAPAPTRGT